MTCSSSARLWPSIISATTAPTRLIHGDLYAPNVLRRQRCGWVALDTDPWAGLAAFDASTVISISDRLDLIAHSPDPTAEVLSRIATFSPLAASANSAAES